MMIPYAGCRPAIGRLPGAGFPSDYRHLLSIFGLLAPPIFGVMAPLLTAISGARTGLQECAILPVFATANSEQKRHFKAA
jgi:hypothetical protein